MNLNIKKSFTLNNEIYHYYSLNEFEKITNYKIQNLPFSTRILLENLLISYGEALITTSKSGLIDLFFFINSSDHISSHIRNLILFFLN